MSQVLRILLAMACVALAACAEHDSGTGEDVRRTPHTGNEVLEKETAPVDEQPQAQAQPAVQTPAPVFQSVVPVTAEIFYVYATQLRVRTTPEVLEDLSNVAGMLNTNDQVRVIGQVLESKMVQVEIVRTVAQLKPSSTYYVSSEHLSRRPQEVRIASQPQQRYFMVQNIASEKLRIYEKQCADGACAHKLVLETDIAVGEKNKDDPSLRTIAGNFHLSKWTKFYQDSSGSYPSWFDPALPMPPRAGAGVRDWTKDRVMPNGGDVRGAFGWYTAFPGGGRTNQQWTHGTIGWGADGKKYIEITRSFLANLFANPRSHGCSRTDNESIAYIRHLLPVGTPMVKIYAREAYADASRQGYSQTQQQWQYILTKNGVRRDNNFHEVADREIVLRNGTPASEWIEEGVYDIDAYPDAKEFREGGGRSARNGKKANVYGLDDEVMRGYFLVDAGLVLNYENPAGIDRGGYVEKVVPDFMVSRAANYQLP
jgi:hypothetical protein